MAPEALLLGVAVVSGERRVLGGLEELQNPALRGELGLLGLLEALEVELGVGESLSGQGRKNA
jgi:hypothetical protein